MQYKRLPSRSRVVKTVTDSPRPVTGQWPRHVAPDRSPSVGRNGPMTSIARTPGLIGHESRRTESPGIGNRLISSSPVIDMTRRVRLRSRLGGLRISISEPRDRQSGSAAEWNSTGSAQEQGITRSLQPRAPTVAAMCLDRAEQRVAEEVANRVNCRSCRTQDPLTIARPRSRRRVSTRSYQPSRCLESSTVWR